MHRIHRRHVDHDSSIACAMSRRVVTAAPERGQQVVLTGKIHCVDHVCDTTALNNQRRVFNYVPIPNASRLIVGFIVRLDHRAAESASELLDRVFAQRCIHSVESLHFLVNHIAPHS